MQRLPYLRNCTYLGCCTATEPSACRIHDSLQQMGNGSQKGTQLLWIS